LGDLAAGRSVWLHAHGAGARLAEHTCRRHL
jgi:hypothetical protein